MQATQNIINAQAACAAELPHLEWGRAPGCRPEVDDVSRALTASENATKVAIAQIATDPGRLSDNVTKIARSIERASAAGASLVVFPELTIPGYGHMDLAYSSNFVQRNKKALAEIAARTGNITAIVGFIDQDECSSAPGGRPRLYNSAAVIRNGEIVATVDKKLIPDYDIFSERRYFEEGRRGGVVEAGGRKLGIGVCEDLWEDGYAKAVYPELIRQGADILINLSCSPFHIGKVSERERVIRQALCGQDLPFLYANLVGSFDGFDGEVVFDGRSMIFDRSGRLCGFGKPFEEDLLVVDLQQPSSLVLPPIEQIHELHDALVLGIRDYFRRSGFERAYIGLSGGIDSSVVAALAVEALGRENVIGVTMPSHITSSETKGDAERLAQNLGIPCKLRPIVHEYRAWEEEFRKSEQRDPESLTKQNKQARIRGAVLMEYTNEDRRGLVISTGNKTELALGYCTLYGDMCGGFAAISDVSKERVYALARYLNQRAGRELIPESVISRVPTAELEVGQTDAGNLPADYDILSPLVDDIVDRQMPYQDLCRKYDPAVVDRTLRLVHGNEFKRRQAAPGIRVTPKAFGIGRRVPMGHGFMEL